MAEPFGLFTKVLANYNIEFDFVDTSDALNVEAAIKPNTKMVFVETPTNPVMIVSDLRGIAEVAHRVRRTRCLRQHFHVSLSTAAVGIWSGYRGPFDHQVSQRTL